VYVNQGLLHSQLDFELINAIKKLAAKPAVSRAICDCLDTRFSFVLIYYYVILRKQVNELNEEIVFR